MKKMLITFLLITVMMLSFAVPAMATKVVATEQVTATMEQEIVPFSERTRIYFRTLNGQAQFRVWSITNGIWLTPWTNL